MTVKFSVVSVCGGASGETSARVASTTFSASSETSSFSVGFSSGSDSCASDSDPESGPDVDSSDSDSLSDSDSDSDDEKTGLAGFGFFAELVVAPRRGTSRTDVGGAIVGKSGRA